MPDDFIVEALATGDQESVGFELWYQSDWYDDGRDNSEPWRYNPGDWEPGHYTLIVKTYSDDNELGTSCATETISFTLMDDCPITNVGSLPSICPTDTVILSSNVTGLNPPFLYVWTDSLNTCLLYTSPSPRDLSTSRMPSSA